MGGQRAAKEYDLVLDLTNFENLLIPFSPTMSPLQYRWYVAEAELPGMAGQYVRTILGGLLRKPPTISLPKDDNENELYPEEALDWIKNRFTEDNRSIISFLDDAVFEELITNRCWVSVDFPVVENIAALTEKQQIELTPYPVMWKAEEVINWQVVNDTATGQPKLQRVIFRYIDKTTEENPFHAEAYPTLADHYLDPDTGDYTVQYYRKREKGNVAVVNGELEVASLDFTVDRLGETSWEPEGDPVVPQIQGGPIKNLPIFPLNGEVKLETPMITSIIDKEIALYNLLTRRNHLLYGASTYTPILKANITTEEFDAIVNRGLGAWIHVDENASIDVLSTPVDALSSLEAAIEAGKEDLAQLGTRMLSPDYAQSGVAMQIRNAPQTAQLGTLNTKISDAMKHIINMMLFWKFGIETYPTDVEFTLSGDFDTGSINPETARLVTEWYQSKLIPRSVWLETVRKLEMIPSDYDDVAGLEEIAKDPSVNDPGYSMGGEY